MIRPRSWVLALGLSTLLAGTARGHVDYVTDESGAIDPFDFLVAVLSEPVNIALLAGAGIVVTLVIGGYLWRRPAELDVAVFRETMRGYADLLPWIFRLSVGLPLVGAGVAGYFYSPSVPPFIPVFVAPSRLFELAIGMMLLFGLASRLAALVGLAVYLLSVPFFPELLLANEFVVGFLAIALVGSGRPSADHVIQQIVQVEDAVYQRLPPIHRVGWWLDRRLEPLQAYTPTIVRVGLGLNFAFLGVTQKLLNPGPALAVVEKYSLTSVVPVSPGMWVVGVGLGEFALGVLLVVGFLTRGLAVAALAMFTLTLFGLPDDPVVAHVSLFGLSSALLVTGSGPLSIDRWLLENEIDRQRPATVDSSPVGE